MWMRQCGCLELYYTDSILVEEFAQRCVALGRFPGIWMCDADFVFDLI
jgi:hypothetical protein